MRKLIAMALVLMLLTGSALAEGLPYIRQMEQYEYINVKLLTEESYPEVCLNPDYYSVVYGRNDSMNFLRFPGPAGAQPVTFSESSCSYLDMDRLIQYSYYLDDRDSFEDFLSDAEADEYILKDGSDGVALFIEPGDYGARAYAMIAVQEFGKTAKLRITITMDDLDKRLPQDQRVQALADIITAEADRVLAQMHIDSFAPYWSYAQFAGVKFLDNDFRKLVTFTFPVLETQFRDGGQGQAAMTVTSVGSYDLDGVYGYDNGVYVGFTIELHTYSYPVYMLENEENSGVEKLVLENGAEWYFYVGNKDSEDGRIYGWKASKVVDGLLDYDGDPYYINVDFGGGSGARWADTEACRKVLSLIDSMITVTDPQDDPYVAPEKAAEPEPASAPATEPAASEESWICEYCATENTGNFCSSCGTPKPVAEEPAPAEGNTEGWICPNCETENTGNFCSNCGTAKPEASGNWFCPDCGAENAGNFCSNCGKAKP